MMSQQQNLPAVSQSLLQQTASQADAKLFSLRQYALASRHRNIHHSWPFAEKHLQLCFNHGIRDVLPPLVQQTSLADFSNLVHSQNDSKEADLCKPEMPHDLIDDHTQNIKNECDHKVTNHNPSSHEEGNQHNCNNVPANLSQSEDPCCTLPTSTTNVHKSTQLLPSSNKVVKDKRKKRRGRWKNKKRSMVDILAVARHCTLEEIYRMNKFCYADETVPEGCCQQKVPSEKFSKSEVAGEDSCKKGGSEDDGVGTNVDNVAGKGPLLLKFKLNGCKL